MRLIPLFHFCMLILACSLVGCKKDPESDLFVKKLWNIQMKGINVVPATPGNGASASALLYLRDDYQLYYDIYFDSLPAGITPDGIDIRIGGPVENNAAALLTITGTFTGNKLKGNMAMPKEVADSLMKTSAYMTITSKSAPGGLVRGQLDKKVSWTMDVNLTPGQVVPAANNSASARLSMRLMEDNTLFYAIDVNGIPSGDVLKEAHIHTPVGASLLKLTSTAADYNKQLSMSVTGEPQRALKSDPLYVDVHSTLFPNGLVRGTLR